MSFHPLLQAAGIFLVLEVVILALGRLNHPFRPGRLFHLWAVVMGLFVGFAGTPWTVVDPLPWKIVCTSALALAPYVVWSLIDAFVLVRRGDPERRPVLPRLLHQVICFLLVGAAAILGLYVVHGVPLPTVLVSSTVLSAVLGLALQDVLKNVLAGIALQLEGRLEVGDWLEIDGHPARVEEMSWRGTRLRTNEGVALLEPNAKFADRQLSSFGSGAVPVALTSRVGLPYETPPARAQEALLAAARAVPGALETPAPVALVRGYGESSIEYELRVWTREVHRIAQFKSELNSSIWHEIERAGLYVPFPIRTVHLRQIED